MKSKLRAAWDDLEQTAYNKGKADTIKLVEVWYNDFMKLVNWHRQRMLLPYDWDDYEHKKLMKLKLFIEVEK
jgi:hypothetical protein